MISYIHGDIFKGKDEVIVHGCNCWCNMGAGIAVQVKNLYPYAYEADKSTKPGDENKLGTYTKWTGNNLYYSHLPITIVNAYTQFYPSVKTKPFDYDAFEKVINRIRKDFNNSSIAFPKIGAGLAGGDWNKIEKVINDYFTNKEVIVYLI